MKKEERFLAAIEQSKLIIYKAARVYTQTQEDQEDLIQEIIYQLWKSFDSFQGHSTVSTWIYRVAMNTAMYHAQKSKKRVFTLPFQYSQIKIADQKESGFEERQQLLDKLLDELTILEKNIVFLYLEEKSYKEIAEIIGISESNVGTKMSRIRNKLKSAAKKH